MLLLDKSLRCDGITVTREGAFVVLAVTDKNLVLHADARKGWSSLASFQRLVNKSHFKKVRDRNLTWRLPCASEEAARAMLSDHGVRSDAAPVASHEHVAPPCILPNACASALARAEEEQKQIHAYFSSHPERVPSTMSTGAGA